MKRGVTILALLLFMTTVSWAQTNKLRTGYLYKVETTIPGRQIYVCGQRPVDSNGEVVGQGDLDIQLLKVFENISTALSKVGMTPENIVQITYHISNGGDKSSYNNERVNQLAATFFSQNKASIPRISELKTVPEQVRADVIIEAEVVAIKN